MNKPLRKAQQEIRFFLYLILVITILSNFLIWFLKLNINNSIVLAIQIVVPLSILIFASIKSIIDWKTLSIYLFIAIMFISIAYFR